jgi:hypothetical protein
MATIDFISEVGRQKKNRGYEESNNNFRNCAVQQEQNIPAYFC